MRGKRQRRLCSWWQIVFVIFFSELWCLQVLNSEGFQYLYPLRGGAWWASQQDGPGICDGGILMQYIFCRPLLFKLQLYRGIWGSRGGLVGGGLGPGSLGMSVRLEQYLFLRTPWRLKRAAVCVPTALKFSAASPQRTTYVSPSNSCFWGQRLRKWQQERRHCCFKSASLLLTHTNVTLIDMELKSWRRNQVVEMWTELSGCYLSVKELLVIMMDVMVRLVAQFDSGYINVTLH